MKITVVGCGRWGSFIANYLAGIGKEVTLYGKESSETMAELMRTRANKLLTLHESIRLSTDLSEAIRRAELAVISVPSQSLRSVAKEMKSVGYRSDVVLCMKGLEIETGKRLTEVAAEELDERSRVAVWIGPGHVQEFTRGIPNCMVIDSESDGLRSLLVDEFSSSLIRFYYGTDLIGNELGAAAKNVIGIAAGMLDGMGLSTLKGALMSRGTREVARLIRAAGGNELSAYGLCHLGDYEATVFSPFSHNRAFGEAVIRGESFDKLAEGHYTVRALTSLAERLEVELPICRTVEDVLYRAADPRTALSALFERSLKSEF